MKIRPKTILYIVYLIILITGYFYVREVERRDIIEVNKKTTKKAPDDEEFVNVKLIIEPNPNLNEFGTELKNTDTLYDMLNVLWKEKQFVYEINTYLYNIELESVNNIKAPNGYRWRVFLNEKDVTDELKDINLKNNDVFIAKFVKIV